MIRIVKIDDEQEIGITNQLNNKIENSIIYNYLKSLNDVKIIDLGCRVPINLMIAYHEFETILLKGVDLLETEEGVIVDFANRISRTGNGNSTLVDRLFDECYTFYSVYKLLFKNVSESYRNEFMTENQFNQVITSEFNFKTKLERFIITEFKKYDLLICNNVLHFTNQKENIISNFPKLLSENGIVFIRVENQSMLSDPNKVTSYDDDYFECEINTVFDEGVIYKKYLNKNWHSMTFINKV